MHMRHSIFVCKGYFRFTPPPPNKRGRGGNDRTYFANEDDAINNPTKECLCCQAKQMTVQNQPEQMGKETNIYNQ